MIEIGAEAALTIRRVQERGYRGIAALSEPRLGQVTVFRIRASGCELVGRGEVAQADEDSELATLPDLIIPDDASPEDAFAIAIAELRRMMARLRH
jgi:hypothetical protein